MKKIGQIVLIVCLASASLLGVAVVLRNGLIKFIIEQGVKTTTGVGLTIDRMHIGLTHASVDIRGMKLHNPWGFHEDIMMDCPQVSLSMAAGELFQRKVHIESFTLHMSEFVVIKNEKGEVNINALKPVQEGKKQQQAAKAPQKSGGPAPRIQIDTLEYTIGKVVFKDYSQGKPPKIQEFPLNVTRKYTNVTNPTFIASVIVADTVARTAVARLAGVDMSGVKSIVSDTLRNGAQSVGGAAQEMIDGLREIFN